jgi:hypothetical protein
MNKSKIKLRAFANINGPLLAVLSALAMLAAGVENQVGYSSPQIPDFNFAAAGDWSCNPDSSRTVGNIEDHSPEIVLALGDYSYQTTADCWFNEIDPINSLTRIAFGNHDVTSPSLINQYLNHFNLEKQFYSFNYQNIHFLVISSEIPYNEGSEQYNFASNDLESAGSNSSIDWIVVYHHRMEYTSTTDTHGSELGLRQALHPLFDKYGVDLVLQAHNHSYERTYPLEYNSANPSRPITTDTSKSTYKDPSGVIYVTVGTGGQHNHEFIEKEPYSVVQWIGHGFLNIDVVDNGLTMKGTLYSNDGTEKDSFTMNKSESASNATSEDSMTDSNATKNGNDNNNMTTSSTTSTTATTLAAPLSFVKNPSKALYSAWSIYRS